MLFVDRTPPYLHDGSAPTLRDVLTTHNPKNLHGSTTQLTPEQIADLLAYLQSL
jgi:cytochrome c peroxidase